MATPRRRPQASGFTSQGIDESLDVSSEKLEENMNTLERVFEEVEEQRTQVLPEIIPTEAPPPTSIKEAVQQEVVLAPEANVQHKVGPKRHPRNIPKFSKVRG